MKKNPADIPYSIWHADDIRRMERETAGSSRLALYELMQQAGKAAFQITRETCPSVRRWPMLRDHGNNGGDDYVAAGFAKALSLEVTLLVQESDKPLPEEAQHTRGAWFNADGIIHTADISWPDNADVITDALTGIGLEHAPHELLSVLVERANSHPAPTVAIDIPSGLLARTRATPGAVINAAHTITFITLKPSLLTGKARDVIGRPRVSTLGPDDWLAG